jgi:hypothetical protein
VRTRERERRGTRKKKEEEQRGGTQNKKGDNLEKYLQQWCGWWRPAWQ